jgi:hypothetical protein
MPRYRVEVATASHNDLRAGRLESRVSVVAVTAARRHGSRADRLPGGRVHVGAHAHAGGVARLPDLTSYRKPYGRNDR